MEVIQKNKNAFLKNFGFGGIGLCALICALPVIGAVLGVGALTAVAAYLEKIGLAVLVLSIGALGIWLYKRRKKDFAAPSCDVDCGCKTGVKEITKT